MSHSSIRLKPGDHVRLRALADKRNCTMVNLLDQLTTAAERGDIYPPLVGYRRTPSTKRVAATWQQRDRLNALSTEWGVYVHQTVAWLLDHEEQVKPQSPHDIWRDMVALRESYERMLAEEAVL